MTIKGSGALRYGLARTEDAQSLPIDQFLDREPGLVDDLLTPGDNIEELDVSGVAEDGAARSAINDIITLLIEKGLMAPPPPGD